MQRLIGGALVIGCIIIGAKFINVEGFVQALLMTGQTLALAGIVGAGCFAGFRIMLADAQ